MNNKKDKCIQLTRLREECYEKKESLKASIKKKIADQIGIEKIKTLKNLEVRLELIEIFSTIIR